MGTSAAVLVAILASLVAAPGPLFIKKASTRLKMDIRFLFDRDLLAGIGFYGASILVTMTALRLGELSLVGPIFSLVYVWVTIISFLFLKEKIRAPGLAGMGLVVAGVMIIASGA